MTNKVELNTLTQVVHKEQAFLTALNENFLKLQQAINDTISRSGQTPNEMEEVLDMNGKRVINVGPAIEDTDALTKQFIDGLIAQVEAAIAQLNDLVNQAIAALQLYAEENIYPVLNQAVADAKDYRDGAKNYYDDTKALYDQLEVIVQNINNILALADDLTNIDAVAGDLTNIDALAASLSDLETIATNISDILAAPVYATNAQTWAEGSDADVAALGGTHSSKGWAEIAQQAAQDTTTYKAFKDSWTTDSTTAAFLADVFADADAVIGMAYLGSLECTDLPTGLNNVEAVVEILPSATASPKAIHIVITSGDVDPYRWELTYWVIGGTPHNSGWIGFQPKLSEGTGIDITSNTISVDFSQVATASQGAKADTALQPGDLADAIKSVQITIATTDWSSNTCTKSVTGVTASSDVFVAPAPTLANIKAYSEANVFCSAVGAGTVTFTCETEPTEALTVNIGVN